MLKNFCILVILASFCCFFYGILNLYVEVEENACRMTYMFGVPQFAKVEFEDNSRFPHYGLFHYSEGRLQHTCNGMRFSGAPVIFVPGNGGSYKQVRSLSSVALRKGAEHDGGVQLDYFTVNFEEQLSALYGGYLENQKQFLVHAIQAVLKLYEKSSKTEKTVVLIGHSMGGKVAQAVLQDPKVSKYINTIISISTPIDVPVVNVDAKINKFYAETNAFLAKRRESHAPNKDTNVCLNPKDRIASVSNESLVLDYVSLISIGGGNRDLLVRDGLTQSEYSDIHAMTTSIPGVWLSCDHLSAVWCLQLVLVVTRFLFAISHVEDNGQVFFIKDKAYRSQVAFNYFVKPNRHRQGTDTRDSKDQHASWCWDSKAHFRKTFKRGIRSEYNHLFKINDYRHFKKVYMDVESYEDFGHDWIHGCLANVTQNEKHKCEKGTLLGQLVQRLPSREKNRLIAIVDVQHIMKYYPEWTHIWVRLRATLKPTVFTVDAYKHNDRRLTINAPRIAAFKPNILINETVLGTAVYGIQIAGLEEPYSTVQFSVDPVNCSSEEYAVTAKLCVPWARGFDRYSHFTSDTKDKSIYVNVPFSAPSGYNTTHNPVHLDLFLNANCRYKISYRYSIAATSSKIVQEFYHWLPAHFVAVLLMVLRNQMAKLNKENKGLFAKPYVGFFQCKSLYVVTACRLLKKMLSHLKFVPIATDAANYSFYVGVVIHGTSIVLSILFVFAVWAVLTFHGNLISMIALRMTKMSVVSSDVFMKVMETLPITFGVVFVSVAMASCSGIGLLFAFVYYFLIISNAYKDYLENWAWDKAKGLYKRVRKHLNEYKGSNSESTNLLQLATEEEDERNGAVDEDGLENFGFHITMLLLLGVMMLLNCGLSIAWIKSHYFSHNLTERLPDPSIGPVVVTLSCLSVLLQIRAPHKSRGYRIVAVFIYAAVCASVLYCQEHIYRLNVIIAATFLLTTIQELVNYILSRNAS